MGITSTQNVDEPIPSNKTAKAEPQPNQVPDEQQDLTEEEKKNLAESKTK